MAAGLVYRSLGFPPQFFTVLFAIPRVTGYLSHWRESLSDPDTKILRPQQDYRVSNCSKELVSVVGSKLSLLVRFAQAVTHNVLACVNNLIKESANVYHDYRDDWSASSVLDFAVQLMLHAKCNLFSMW